MAPIFFGLYRNRNRRDWGEMRRSTLTFSTSNYAILFFAWLLAASNGWSEDAGVVFQYDSQTGNLSIESQLPVTTMQLMSRSGAINGVWPTVATGPFDEFHPYKLFLLNFNGFNSADFGPVYPAGLTVDFLKEDVCIYGSKLPEGFLGQTTFMVDDQSFELSEVDCNANQIVEHDAKVRLHYAPETGELSLHDLDGLNSISSLQLFAGGNLFSMQNYENLDGPFDVGLRNRFTKVDRDGFETVFRSERSCLKNLDVTQLAQQMCGDITDEFRFSKHDLYLDDQRLEACRPGAGVKQLIDDVPPEYVGLHYKPRKPVKLISECRRRKSPHSFPITVHERNFLPVKHHQNFLHTE